MDGELGDVPALLGDRYLLGRELGHGGMAVVYQAWDSRLDRDVAVKVMREVVRDPAHRERFQVEGQTLAGLSHPGLIMLLDAGTEGDRPFLVMELVTGETLADLTRRRWLGVPEVAAIGRALAEALSYVHGQGIVHRDVKPSNVLVGPDERIRLADFGIARLLDSPVRHTATGLMLGTAAYLSPEQVRGESASAASDVYALGLVLIESLTGRPVFSGPPHVAALARLIEAPVIDEGLPATLRDVLTAMTADRPADRPTATEVAVRLKYVMAETPAGRMALVGNPEGRAFASDDPETVSTQESALGSAPLAHTAPSRRPLAARSLAVAVLVAVLVAALAIWAPTVLRGAGDGSATASEPLVTSSPATAGPSGVSRPGAIAGGATATDVTHDPSPRTGAANPPRPTSAVSDVSVTVTPAKAQSQSNSTKNQKAKKVKKVKKTKKSKDKPSKSNSGKGKGK